jgi:hypothetical protein
MPNGRQGGPDDCSKPSSTSIIPRVLDPERFALSLGNNPRDWTVRVSNRNDAARPSTTQKKHPFRCTASLSPQTHQRAR